MSLRRMDFHCPVHKFFEASEALSAPVSQTWPCPKCGVVSPKVWVKAPHLGKIQSGHGFVTKFPVGDPRKGKFVELPRDHCEELISREEGVPFADEPGFAERIFERALEKTYKREQGDLPPREERPPTDAEVKIVEKQLANAGMKA